MTAFVVFLRIYVGKRSLSAVKVTKLIYDSINTYAIDWFTIKLSWSLLLYEVQDDSK